MDQMIKLDKVDFKMLVAKDSKLSLNFQTKMTQRLSETFTEEQQRWYVGILYLYLNTDPKDFPINLENVYSLIGFAHKKNATRTLKNNFTVNEDYKIRELPKEGSSWGGSGGDEIMLSVETFKGMCMMSKTEKGKEIRKYYSKLENILNDILIEERLEYQNKIKKQDLQLQIKELELEKTMDQLKKKNKLSVKKWFEEEPGDIIYAYNSNGHNSIEANLITIGKTKNVKHRESNYLTHNPDGEMFYIRRCFNYNLAEKVIHHILDKYREENNKEWFNIQNDLATYIIDTVCDFLDKFIKCSERLPEFKIKEFLSNIQVNETLTSTQTQITPTQINQESDPETDSEYDSERDDQLKELTKLKQQKEKRQDIKQIPKKNGQKLKNKTGNWKGVCFSTEKQKWKAELKKDYVCNFLGYYDTELEGAKAYNDYATYLNNTTNTEYVLNDIPDYTPTPRDIITEIIATTSQYIGVSYDSNRKYFVSSIRYKDVCYNLGSNSSEIECAKKYNQQALYFNNTYNTKYFLNDIPGYITVAKNIHQEIQENKKKKTSKYVGVCLNKTLGNFKAYLVFNKKQVNIGCFGSEIEAAKMYNKKATELNEKFKKSYKINVIEENEEINF